MKFFFCPCQHLFYMINLRCISNSSKMAEMSMQPAIKFFSFTFCPFSQRTWIVLKKLNLKYEMIEGFKINENGVVFKDERL